MHYGMNQKRGPVSTLGLLFLGVLTCGGWALSIYPDMAHGIISNLSTSDYVVLALFLVVGLLAASLLASMFQVALNLLMFVMQIGLLVVVVAACVVVWRNFSVEKPSDYSVVAPLPNTNSWDATAADQNNQSYTNPNNDEERRRQLEKELYKLDTKDGGRWWQKK